MEMLIDRIRRRKVRIVTNCKDKVSGHSSCDTSGLAMGDNCCFPIRLLVSGRGG